MALTGPFQNIKRTGAESGSTVEVVLNDLLNARGTAYDIQEGSTVWAENFSYAKALADLYETIQRMANQFDPSTMYQYLSRWETMLGIIVPAGATISSRQAMVSLYLQKWTLPPTVGNLTYFTQQLLGNVFIGFSFYNPNGTALSFAPTGQTASFPQGANVLNGPWKSYISYIQVIVWQPRDKYGNLLMDNATFNSIYRSFYSFYASYLPAYVSFGYLQYTNVGTGSIYGYFNSTTITGVGTNFQSGATSIQVIYDDGTVAVLPIASVQSATSLTLVSPLTKSITGNIGWRTIPSPGFFLDTPNNLDNATFAH